MRISLVVPDIETSSGGLARNVPRLARALRESGASVELSAVGRGPESGAIDGHTFLGAPRRPRALGRSPELRRHLLGTPTDLVHANGLWMAPLGYAAEAARQRSVPLVVSPRGMFSPWAMRRSPWKKALALRLIHPGAFRTASGWHVTSADEEADVLRLGFTQPICVAPNGVDPPTDDPVAAQAIFGRLAPGLIGKRVLLFYSRFHSKKGVLELIRDFAAIAGNVQGWHLLIVGIPEEYSVADLRTTAGTSGVADAVSILDGRALPAPYPVADLMALPSRSENFGQVIAEALVHAVPVVTTTATPWAALNDRRAGACADIGVYREALAQWMSFSPGARRDAGMRGRDWVLAEFGWGATAARLISFYEALISRAARAASA